MKRVRRILDALLPAYSRIPLILAVVWNGAAYYGGRLIARHWPHYRLELALDAAIPFLPWTVSVYVLSYFFWVVNYVLAARRDRASVYRFFCADFVTRCVCLLCFVVLPTTNVRPEVVGNDVWSELMRWLYRLDAADNLLPSIHCIASCLAAAGIRNDKRVPLWYRVFSCLFAAAICVSTVTTKQHVAVDVIGGVALAAAAYRIASVPSVWAWYARFTERVRQLAGAVFR